MPPQLSLPISPRNTATACRGPVWISALALLASVAACETNKKPEKSQPDSSVSPVELLEQTAVVDSYLILVDKRNDRALILNVAAQDVETLISSMQAADLEPNPFLLAPRKGAKKEALIMSAGLRGVSKPSALSALSVKGAIRTYVIGAPFDALLQSEDGKYALLYYGQGADQLLYNRNEIAVVNLNSAVSKPDGGSPSTSGVTRRSVATPAGEPTHVALSPSLTIGVKKVVLAVVLSEAYATLIDITNTKRGDTLVQLSGTEPAEAIRPEQVLFNTSQNEIYIRGTNSNDVFILRLAAGDNDFKTSVDQISVGSAPADMALYEDNGASRLLVASPGSGDAYVVRLSAGESSSEADAGVPSEPAAPAGMIPEAVRIRLQAPADQVLPFKAGDPDDTRTKEQRALLYQRGGRAVAFLDLKNADSQKEQNLQTIELHEPITRVIPMLSQNLAVLLHDSPRLDVLDLVKRKITVIAVNASIEDAVFSSVQPRLWIAPAGQYFLGYVDLNTGDTNEVMLDQPLQQLVMVPSVSVVVAVQQKDDKVGITALDANEPSRDTAVSLSDIFNHNY